MTRARDTAALAGGGAVVTRQIFTATAGQTTFSPSAGYNPGALEVYMNGLLLATADYTATNGTSIVLAVAANVGDEIEILTYQLQTLGDVVPASTGGTFSGSVNVSGDVGVTGNIGIRGSSSSPLHVTARGIAWEDHVTLESSTGFGWNFLVDAGDNNRLRIRNANNNLNAFNIDAGGRVTMPYQPSFYARLTTGVATRNAVVVFDEIRLNVGNNYSSSTGRFTAPVNGVYLITAGFLPNTDNNSYGYIQVNGTRYSERMYNQYSDQHTATTLHVLLEAGDYVEFYTVGDGTEALYCHFGGHLVG